MAQKSSGRGLSSSAGLVTYYDADNKKSLHLKPTVILIVALAIGIAVYVLNLVFKLTTGA
ncbi:MAG TPA: preprotein translocase subunit Sec61beta [Methanocorpusculum sp.]|nr:preprotein translocase subunit Sec61beta [Methanocorpusculum sp.]HJJ39690.1 preprotein translocase subunit Sec61beta [Methanocorpusculum sp.]HJJ49299.1 preprotein translocase subunit Sec61beta [Methanocorpusculum sp.]HJJ56657.1 preprotein translocase subunit Sec61beta [Methanocorpusculum sp.]HJJ95138.1 preprotein translocase subunit Sec61beta [Methanocorpusculum sp.]